MNVYDLLVAAGIVADAWLLAFVALRTHPLWLKALFVALALTCIVNGAAYVGVNEGFLGAEWATAILWSLVLAHPLAAILVLGLIHGETLPRRRPAVLLLLAPVPILALLAPSMGVALPTAYGTNLLGGFLIVCLGVALAEPIYQRRVSPLLATDSFWLIAAVIALIIGGPVYNYEFDTLGFVSEAGSNALAPVALALLALVALHADPFPFAVKPSAGTAGVGGRAPGRVVLFDEAEPTYLRRAARDAAAVGRPVLHLARYGTEPEGAVSLGVARLLPSPHAALRTLATASEFLSRHPGGLVALEDAGDVAVLAGWPKTRDMLVRLRRLCRDTGAEGFVTTSRLLRSEREDLAARGFQSWSLPNPAVEMEAILARSFGSGAKPLLRAFADARGLAPGALTADDVPALADFLDRALHELGRAAGDPRRAEDLRAQAAPAVRALRAFAARTPEDLARSGWPSAEPREADQDLLVTATDYWKGKEMDELFAAAKSVVAQPPLGERARSAFVEQLGDAGDGMFRSELAKLGKRPEELRPEDVARLADRAAVDLGAMAEVVDVPQERTRLRNQIEVLRRRLETIAGEDA